MTRGVKGINKCGHSSRKHEARGMCQPCYDTWRRVSVRKREIISSRKWRKVHPEVQRAHALKSLYGITIETYNMLALRQGGKCAVCGKKPKRLVVDHDHRTGTVRGLLCRTCNSAIGFLGDNLEGLMGAVVYLKAVQHEGAG